MLSRTVTRRLLARVGVRSIVNPAINHHTGYIQTPVLPFGMDFVEPRLKKALEARGVDVDAVERLYNTQVRDDHEFNSPALPRHESGLWPYAYGEWLVRSKVRLDTLSDEEAFAGNYLRTLVTELKMRMDTLYPDYDWRAVAAKQMDEVSKEVNDAFENAYAEATADIIARDPKAYVEYFRNNAFIEKYDEDDKFTDNLPRELDDTLTKRFEFAYDFDASTDPSKYFESLQRLDAALSVPIDAIGGELRNAFNKMLQYCFGKNNTDVISDLVAAVNNATTVAHVNLAEKSVSNLVDEIFDVLELSAATTVGGIGAQIVANLLFGKDSLPEIEGQSVDSLKTSAASQPIEKLQLLRKALEIVQYLKSNSASRLILAVALNENPSLFAQYLTDSDKMDLFLGETVPTLEEAAAVQRDFYAANEKVAEALEKLIEALVAAAPVKDSAHFREFLRTDGVSAICSVSLRSEACQLIGAFKRQAAAAAESGAVTREAQASAYVSHLSTESGAYNTYFYLLGAFALNTPERGFSVEYYTLYDAVANKLSEAQDAFQTAVGEHLSAAGVAHSEISKMHSAVSKECAELQEASKAAAALVQKRGEIFEKLEYNFDGAFDFERIRENYNPFDIHLAQFKYLTPR